MVCPRGQNIAARASELVNRRLVSKIVSMMNLWNCGQVPLPLQLPELSRLNLDVFIYSLTPYGSLNVVYLWQFVNDGIRTEVEEDESNHTGMCVLFATLEGGLYTGRAT